MIAVIKLLVCFAGIDENFFDDTRICEFGIRTDCRENEICYIPDNVRKRVGICKCMEGYEQNNNGHCELSTVSGEFRLF